MRKTWTIASGEQIVDREPSHIHAGVTDELLSEALAHARVRGEERTKYAHDFGRPVGSSNCVQTRDGDKIVFARRVHRDGLSRFVKNRESEPTTLLTVSFRLIDGLYVLRTAYIGGPGATEPWAATAPARHAEAVAFWSVHALCWGHEPIIAGTVTTVCPW